MSHLFVDNEHIKLDIPLISVPQTDGKFLLVKNADGYEWKSLIIANRLSIITTITIKST